MTAMHVVAFAPVVLPSRASEMLAGRRASPDPYALGCLLGMPTDGNGFLAPGAGIGDEAFRRQQKRSGHFDPESRKLQGMTSAKFT